MKRDLNLLRSLLLFYESDCSIDFPDAEDEAIRQHVCMMIDAGLLDGKIVTGGSGAPQHPIPFDGRAIENHGKRYCSFRVTWDGHEFLAAARDDTRWNTAMKKIGPAIGGMTLDIVKAYLEQQIKSTFGIGD